MIIRKGVESDDISEIWAECFPNEDEFFKFFMRRKFAPSNMYVCEEADGELSGMVHVFPHEIVSGTAPYQMIDYVFALASRKKYRGRGIARALLGAVKSQRLFLIPQTPDLFGFYTKLGFITQHSPVFSAETSENERSAEHSDIPFLNELYMSNFSSPVKRSPEDWKDIIEIYNVKVRAGGYVVKSGSKVSEASGRGTFITGLAPLVMTRGINERFYFNLGGN